MGTLPFDIPDGKEFVPTKILDHCFDKDAKIERNIAFKILCAIRDSKISDQPFNRWTGREFCKKHQFNYNTFQVVMSKLKNRAFIKEIPEGYEFSLEPLIELLKEWQDFLNFK